MENDLVKGELLLVGDPAWLDSVAVIANSVVFSEEIIGRKVDDHS